MAKSCAGANTHGPLVQVLFLGLTVKSFSASGSWGDQSSNLTVELVYDPCSGVRKYCTDNLLYTSGNFNRDPGWNGAPVGSCAFFKLEGFEFCGIIQSYTTKYDASGYPIYHVVLSSPASLLSGTQVITDKYQDIVYGMPNVFNTYAFLESLEEDCPLFTAENGVTFGSLAGGFGYSKRTERGTPWIFIKRALSVLTGGRFTSTYSPYGTVLYISGVGTYGSILSNKYIVDISDLPEPQNQSIYDYRLEGSVFSILDLANQVCDDAGYDYFIDIMPVQGGVDSITNVIKFRTIIRSNQPSLSSISTFVNSAPNVISHSIGQELRNENNSSMIFGASKRQYFEQEDNTHIAPYWGKDSLGELITSNYDGDDEEWRIYIDMRKLRNKFSDTTAASPILTDFMWITETQLRASLSGEKVFRNIVGDPRLVANVTLRDRFPLSDFVVNVLGVKKTDIPLDRVDVKNTTSTVTIGKARSTHADTHDERANDFKVLLGFLKSFAEEHYMKKFMVSMPFVCYDTDTDTGEKTFSDLPSLEGGWISGTGLLGAPYPTGSTDKFRDDLGKVSPVLKFSTDYPYKVNMSGINEDQYMEIPSNGPLFDMDYWVLCEMEEEWVTGNPVLFSGYASGLSTASAILTLPQRLEYIHANNKLSTISPDLGALDVDSNASADVTISLPLDEGDYKKDKKLVSEAVEPSKAGVPVVSNTQTYGPWYSQSAVVGGVTVEQDEGLAPWEYGSLDNLEYAALSRVSQSVTEQQVSENGSVTLAGYPTVTLGSAIDGSVSLFNERTLSIGTVEEFEYYFINVGGPSSAGAQVTNINVNIGSDGATTQYQLSSFTPVFGRFSKANADRLKLNAQNARKAQRNAFAKSRLRSKI